MTSVDGQGVAGGDGRYVVVSCEHGGREVPPAYGALFVDHAGLLDSHRGWDPGALELGGQIAATRLLVDLNRSIGHRQLYSEATRGLTRGARAEIAARHYRPHRDAVEGEIARRIATGAQVIHIASHSFTPVMAGVVRRADVAWLYDPKRAGESALAKRWMAELARRAPDLRLRRNYPYQGSGDGLATLLRRRFPGAAYVGIELEVNQRFVAQGGAPWHALRADLVASLQAALREAPAAESR